MAIKTVILDIEGTTTSIDFVHRVLFPYSQKHLRGYVQTHLSNPFVTNQLKSCLSTVSEESSIGLSVEGRSEDELAAEDISLAITHLEKWITEDRKHPALKALQGKIWQRGFEEQQYKSDIYPDVLTALQFWSRAGTKMYIYSSGSVEAQVLLFRHTEYGDLSSFFSGNFDTQVGNKREAESYRKILQALSESNGKDLGQNRHELDPGQVLFISDISEELDAARSAGMQTLHIIRGPKSENGGHMQIRTFDEIHNTFNF